jgi:DNA-binding Lrp family transcriptional regulator
LSNTKAFILVNVELGSENIFETLRKIPNVKEAYLTYGLYDIVALVEAQSMDQVKTTVTNQIRKLPGVRTTLTMVVVDEARPT